MKINEQNFVYQSNAMQCNDKMWYILYIGNKKLCETNANIVSPQPSGNSGLVVAFAINTSYPHWLKELNKFLTMASLSDPVTQLTPLDKLIIKNYDIR